MTDQKRVEKLLMKCTALYVNPYSHGYPKTKRTKSRFKVLIKYVLNGKGYNLMGLSDSIHINIFHDVKITIQFKNNNDITYFIPTKSWNTIQNNFNEYLHRYNQEKIMAQLSNE